MLNVQRKWLALLTLVAASGADAKPWPPGKIEVPSYEPTYGTIKSTDARQSVHLPGQPTQRMAFILCDVGGDPAKSVRTVIDYSDQDPNHGDTLFGKQCVFIRHCATNIRAEPRPGEDFQYVLLPVHHDYFDCAIGLPRP